MKTFPLLALAALALASCALNHSNGRSAGQRTSARSLAPDFPAAPGRALFLKNCAHCHGADAGGDEGPDLHNLDLTDDQIAARVRNGKSDEMTAFAGKLSTAEISAIVAYVRGLKRPAR